VLSYQQCQQNNWMLLTTDGTEARGVSWKDRATNEEVWQEQSNKG